MEKVEIRKIIEDIIITIFNKAPAFKQGINDSFIHICIF